MPTLTLETATLHYTTTGTGGPLLLLIPGAVGTGTIFHALTPPLSQRFQVVTYDRRGYSQSPLHGDQAYAHRLDTDADDAVALIRHLTDAPALAFGSSTGAIIASRLLRRHPALFAAVCVHEPPLFRLLPDADDRFADLHRVYSIYREEGTQAGMRTFMSFNLEESERGQLARNADENDPYAAGNTLYSFERELLVYPFSEAGIAELATLRDRLIIGVSATASALPSGRVAMGMAEQLGESPLVLPGGHLGYVVLPEEFAEVLGGALG